MWGFHSCFAFEVTWEDGKGRTDDNSGKGRTDDNLLGKEELMIIVGREELMIIYWERKN